MRDQWKVVLYLAGDGLYLGHTKFEEFLESANIMVIIKNMCFCIFQASFLYSPKCIGGVWE